MGIRKLTAEGRFEAGVDEVVKGKQFAFVAVIGKNYPWRLGLAIADEQGYNPVPEFWAHGDDMQAFHDHADELNAAMGLSKDEELAIVASTMGGMPYGQGLRFLRQRVKRLDDADLSAELDALEKRATVPGSAADRQRGEDIAAIRAEFVKRAGGKVA